MRNTRLVLLALFVAGCTGTCSDNKGNKGDFTCSKALEPPPETVAGAEELGASELPGQAVPAERAQRARDARSAPRRRETVRPQAPRVEFPGRAAEELLGSLACVREASQCALDRMEDPSNEATIDACLVGAALADGTDCAAACDGRAADLCAELASELGFFAGRSSACRGEMSSCLAACFQAGEPVARDSDDVWAFPEATCWLGGAGQGCSDYARGHELCGGTDYQLDTPAERAAFGEAARGCP